MAIDLLRHFWLEAEQPVAQTAPTSDPSLGATANPQAGGELPQSGPTPEATPEVPDEEDITQDPEHPELPEDSEDKDFEQWRREFLDLSIKGDTNEMLNSIKPVRDLEGLESSQKKFIEDNFQILLYRQDANITKVSKEIRKLIKDDLDRSTPGTTVAQHIVTVLDENPIVNQVLIKLTGMYGLKGDLHRKFVAAIIGGVQVGGGNKNREDLIFTEDEYTINISTRFYTQFGEVNLGAWSLEEDDPKEYLTEPELKRLSDGSPEEKQVLRRRIIMESIAKRFEKRAFIIHCVYPDGTIHTMGWDLGTSLTSAYKEGKLIVRGKKSEEKEVMISDTGEITPLVDIKILYVNETGEIDDNGKPEMVEIPFMERRDSILYLVGDLDLLRDASTSMNGIFFHETPYNGNPSDIPVLQKCVPDLPELLNRRCI